MAEQPPRQIGKYTIQGQSDNGMFAHAYLAVDNQSDGDLDLSPSSEAISGGSLYDLCLPEKDSEFYKFIDFLRNLKYKVEHIKIGISRKHTCKYTHVEGENVEGESQCRALIYIPMKSLNNPDPVDLAYVTTIGSFFDKKTTVIIFSKSSEYPDEDIKGIVEDIWSAKGKFVPWKYVKSLIEDYDRIKGIQSEKEKEENLKLLKKDVAKHLDGMLGKKDTDSI